MTILPSCVVISGVKLHLPLQNRRLNGLNRNLSAIPDQVISSDDLRAFVEGRPFLKDVLRGEIEIAPLIGRDGVLARA